MSDPGGDQMNIAPDLGLVKDDGNPASTISNNMNQTSSTANTHSHNGEDDDTAPADSHTQPASALGGSSDGITKPNTTPPIHPKSTSPGKSAPKDTIDGSFGTKGFFSLTKKKKKTSPPRVQSSGIVNYGVGMGQNSDSESEASSISVASVSEGYNLPFAMQAGYKNTQIRDPDLEDDASVRTPIPTGPPDPSMVLASAFLRDRNASASNVSDLSEEESSVVKRQKREAENVGRLVEKAKKQQSVADLWFSAGTSANANALPKLPLRRKNPANMKPLQKKTSFKDPERNTGPIDLDSGDVWGGDSEQGSKSNWEVGSFNYTGTTHTGKTKKRKNQGFITFGVPDDEDLTTYYTETKCCDRTVCTIGNTRCSMLALIVLAFGAAGIIVGGTITGVNLSRKDEIIEDNVGTLPPKTIQPSSQPSTKPTLSPSWEPSTIPSSTPSMSPTSQPSISPTTSQIPSMAPSSSPSQYFPAQQFMQVGQDLKLEGGSDTDGFGESISVSEGGDIVAVGSTLDTDGKGSVRVYRLDPNASVKTWVQMGNTIEGLAISSPTGPSVEITRNGQAVIIGEQNPTAVSYTGFVRIFSYDDTANVWEQVGNTIEEDEANAEFGHSLAISDLNVGPGLIVAVSSPNSICPSAKVTAYELNVGNEWEELATVTSGAPFFNFAKFGHSISLSSDGTVLACSAPDGSHDYYSLDHGYVEIFELERGGFSAWIPRGELIPYEGEAFSTLANFGESISLSADGSRVAIGSRTDMIESIESSGSVSVYEYNSVNYEMIGNRMVGLPKSQQSFGQSVALSSDGKYVTVGAVTSTSGQVFVYRDNNASWEAAKIIDGEQGEQFGNAVAISVQNGDETDLVTVAVGAPFFGFNGQGVARVYESELRAQL